jgi:hypothetical protein
MMVLYLAYVRDTSSKLQFLSIYDRSVLSIMQYIALQSFHYRPILHSATERLSILRFRQGEATCLA